MINRKGHPLMKTLKFIFSSLFSNETVIKESKNKPWWLAIILMLVSCIISIVPNFVTVMKTNGSDILTQNANYSIDYSLKKFSQDYLDSSDIEIKIENGKLTAKNFDERIEVKHQEKITLIVQYVPYDTENDRLLYDSYNDKINAYVKEIKTSYDVENDGDTLKSHLYSTLILGSESVFLYLYDSAATCTFKIEADNTKTITNETSPAAQTYGTYKNISGDLAVISGYYRGNSDAECMENALASWKNFFDKAYQSPRNVLAFQYSGMYLGIDILIIAVMGLMIFLLSRTKSSIQRYTYLQGLKMVSFATLSPALLALILGFLIPALQSMGFLMFLILRVTWLGMKATSPANNGQPVRK